MSIDNRRVPSGDVLLINARSVAMAMPDRWWAPSDEILERVAPGTEVKVRAVRREEDGGADLWDATSIWVRIDVRDMEEVEGAITDSDLDLDGYREGDRLRAGLDRIFDVVFVDDEGRPSLNVERARFAIGKRVLIGLTMMTEAGEPVERRQFLGTVARIDPVAGIELTLGDGSAYQLPPDVRPLEEAPPGEYRLRSTSELVIDPDYTCTWTVQSSGTTSD
jgi:hypothetical protein